MSKKAIISVVMVALAVPMTSASVASADETGACVFTGATGGIAPNGDDNPAATGVQSVLTDLWNLDLLDTDSGGFTFGTDPILGTVPNPSVCVIIDDLDDGEDDPEEEEDDESGTGIYMMDIEAGGTYVNQICGTGTANGNATVTLDNVELPVVPGDAEVETLEATFGIDFYAGQGLLDISEVHDEDASGTGAGYVNIVPLPPDGGDCVINDASEIAASGAFVITLEDDEPEGGE